MKFKLMYILSWAVIFLFIPINISFGTLICYLALQQNDYRFFYVLAVPFVGLAEIAFRAMDYLSTVIIDNRGVEAKLFGRTWFSAGWSEIQYIVEYEMVSNKSAMYICFSKESLNFTKRMFFSGTPLNTRLKGKAMIMMESEKVRQEVLKYVHPEKIEHLGRLKTRDLPKK